MLVESLAGVDHGDDNLAACLAALFSSCKQFDIYFACLDMQTCNISNLDVPLSHAALQGRTLYTSCAGIDGGCSIPHEDHPGVERQV